MTEDKPPESPAEAPPPPAAEEKPPQPVAAPLTPAEVRTATLYKLCEEVIALRERCDRQHREFEKALSRTQATMQTAFNTFAADTQRAYQQLRQEINGEKRTTMTLLGELMEIGLELQAVVQARPASGDAEALARWADSVEVHGRKVREVLERHGLSEYEAAVGSAYDPALHERVGGRPVEGTPPGRVVEQVERGYASRQPDFTLRRPKVIVSD